MFYICWRTNSNEIFHLSENKKVPRVMLAGAFESWYHAFAFAKSYPRNNADALAFLSSLINCVYITL